MNNTIKFFIESNIELIEKEDWETFFLKADDYMFNNKLLELVIILEEASIDTVAPREHLLLEHMVENFSKESLHDKFGPGSVVDMITLVDAGLDTYYGFEKEIVGEYVMKWLSRFPSLEYKAAPKLFIIKE